MNPSSVSRSSQLIRARFKEYGFDDVARALFVLTTWLPNVASPVKALLLYVILESLRVRDFKGALHIGTYDSFAAFCQWLTGAVPSFPSIEDYVPEPDWGQVKYFFGNRFYRVFYGTELENIYEFHACFEVIHLAFEDAYVELTGRSPTREFEACLTLQDYLLREIGLQPNPGELEIAPGDFAVPPEQFWEAAASFLDGFSPEALLDGPLLKAYTRDLDTSQASRLPGESRLVDRLFRGLDCRYYFLRLRDRYYPVLPRRFFLVLFESWASLLADNYDKISERVRPEIATGIRLHGYIRERVGVSQLYEMASAVDENLRPSRVVFTTAIHAKDKLFLVHVLPPSSRAETLECYLRGVAPEIKNSLAYLSECPTRLGLLARNEIVEFRSEEESDALDPRALVIIPFPSTDLPSSNPGKLRLPEGLPARVMTLDQFLGIIDEMDDAAELTSFFEYLEELRRVSGLSPINTDLDRFASYRHSRGILVPGALDPDIVFLDPHMGSNFRYESLSHFFSIFPETALFGNPRSWAIQRSSEGHTGTVLVSKAFAGYTYYHRIDGTHFFVRSPAHLVTFEQGKTTDLLMRSLLDGLSVYGDHLRGLPYSGSTNYFDVVFFPSSLVQENEKLTHVRHLVPHEHIWQSDITRLGANSYGVRIVFDERKALSQLHDAKDRSAQIDLLLVFLERLNTVLEDNALPGVRAILDRDRAKASRFKVFEVTKEAAFPEAMGTTLPGAAQFRRADKRVARIANRLGLAAGTHTLEEARARLGDLIKALVEDVNAEVALYNFEKSIGHLVEQADALTNRHQSEQHSIEHSLDQEVDYNREERSSQKHSRYLIDHKNYRYLIEKFVQLQPDGVRVLDTPALADLLAQVDSVLRMYAASDALWYGIFPADVTINDDYTVSLRYSEDAQRMQGDFARAQARMHLGISGMVDDGTYAHSPADDYINEIEDAFKRDLGFGIRCLVSVLEVMSMWPCFNPSTNEGAHYRATADQLSDVCMMTISGSTEGEIRRVLDFLTLKSESLLRLEGTTGKCRDLPVWEHRKRATRYTIKPLIRIADAYLWGPYAARQSSGIWANVPHTNRLPADFKAKSVQRVLQGGHKDVEQSLVVRTEEIVGRFSPLVVSEVFLHKIDKVGTHPLGLGDYDVLAMLGGDILLNIECKVMDPPYCLKDARRLRERIFGRAKTSGAFQEGYLQKVERRARHLREHAHEITQALGWNTRKDQTEVISVFVTQLEFWWTRFPPVATEVKFVHIRVLHDFLAQTLKPAPGLTPSR